MRLIVAAAFLLSLIVPSHGGGARETVQASSDYINIGDMLSTGQLTAMIWFKTPSSGCQAGRIIFSKYGAVPAQFEIGIDGGSSGGVTNPIFARADNSGNFPLWSFDNTGCADATREGVWIHLTARYNGNMELFVNGEGQGATSNFTKGTRNSDDTWIGARSYTGAETYTSGKYAFAHVFSTGLSDDTILELSTGIQNSIARKTTLTGEWPLTDVGSDPTFRETAINTYPGTNSGADEIFEGPPIFYPGAQQ